VPDTPLNPPDSPPVGPVIPEGLATKLGKWGTAASILLALLVEVLEINLSEDTEKLALGGLALALTTIAGRMAQSAAALRDAPSPRQQGDPAVCSDCGTVGALGGPDDPYLVEGFSADNERRDLHDSGH
jgi:hypothetical protein